MKIKFIWSKKVIVNIVWDSLEGEAAKILLYFWLQSCGLSKFKLTKHVWLLLAHKESYLPQAEAEVWIELNWPWYNEDRGTLRHWINSHLYQGVPLCLSWNGKNRVKSLIRYITGGRFPGTASSFEYDTEAQDRFFWYWQIEYPPLCLHIHSDEKYTCNPCELSHKHRITSLCPEYLQVCLQPDILQLSAFIPDQYSIFIRFCMQFKGPNLSSWLPDINLNT